MHIVAESISRTPAAAARGRTRLVRQEEEELREALRAQEIEEKMGQGAKHGAVIDLFTDSLRASLAEQQRVAYVGWDLFVEWDPNDPRARVSPDAFLLEGQSPDIEPSIWCTWQPGCDPPRFAVEVVSDSSRAKDYDEKPGKYAALGVEELVVFNPGASEPPASASSELIQVFRRSPRGQFLRVYHGNGPVESVVLGRWLVATNDGKRLRLARNAEGTDLIPTKDERAQAADSRAQAADSRAQAADSRAQAAVLRAEEEARLRQEAERLLADTLAELERLKGSAALSGVESPRETREK